MVADTASAAEGSRDVLGWLGSCVTHRYAASSLTVPGGKWRIMMREVRAVLSVVLLLSLFCADMSRVSFVRTTCIFCCK